MNEQSKNSHNRLSFEEDTEEPFSSIVRQNFDPEQIRGKEKSVRKKIKAPSNREILQDAIKIDLHGKTVRESIQILQNLNLRYPHQKCFVIVTGKGYNSGEEGPVLRPAVESWLNANPEKIIKNFRQAPAKMGGSGAFLLFLK